jgi:hypothetical protein
VVRQAIILAALTAGCSATKEIASSASVASNAAHSISERSAFIITHSAQPEIVAAAVTIKADADIILHETHQISVAVSGVKDAIPFWATLLQYGLLCAILLGAVALLWMTGLGTLIRVAIGWIPRRVQNEADLAGKMLSDDPATAREFVAARRASDPLFAAAWGRSTK